MTSLKNHWIIALLLILAATLISFLPSLFNDFVNYDDPVLIFENALIREGSFSNAVNIFKTQLSGNHSRFNPLVFISYMSTLRFFGPNPFWFHATSLLFHLGCVAAAFWLTMLLTQSLPVSVMTSLLFGIHPIHVEPVAWISSLMHVMYSLFYLLSLILFLKAIRSERANPLLLFASFISFVICGCCFSAGAATLPAILLLLCVWQDSSLQKKRLALLLPFFALSLFWAWITVFAAKNSHIITNPYFNTSTYSLNERIHLSSLSIFYYLRQLIAPLNFTIVYPEGYYSHPFNALYTVFLAVGILALLMFYKRRPVQTRPVFFGALFFLITILPFLKIYSTTSSLTNDRYCYLACYGIFFILALWANLLLEKRVPLIRTVSAIAAVYLLIITWSACRNWKNSATLWSNQITAYPKAYPAYVGRADFYLSQGRYQNALDDLDRALQLKPDYIEALNLKGTTLLLSGSPQSPC
ncbi:MAG TPA: tetratricopeptide repeat protein [Candidatus Omnitrophota bacterium]|nr:tetratricopeptide repeat protein [Candidatus Omnitrophota bacterium]